MIGCQDSDSSNRHQAPWVINANVQGARQPLLLPIVYRWLMMQSTISQSTWLTHSELINHAHYMPKSMQTFVLCFVLLWWYHLKDMVKIGRGSTTSKLKKMWTEYILFEMYCACTAICYRQRPVLMVQHCVQHTMGSTHPVPWPLLYEQRSA